MKPMSSADRHVPLDTLRGLALAGVLLVNLLTLFRVSLFSHIAGTDASAEPAGRLIASFVHTFLEFKAYTLFAFLFGAGVAVQIERISLHHSATRFLLRRFVILLFIGLIHLLLIWNGDILTLYAICGLLLIPALRLPTLLMAIAGAGLILVSLPVAFPSTQALALHGAAATHAYSTGSFVQILVFRWHETNRLMLPLLFMTLPKTVGIMLLGAAAWRSKLLTDRRRLWLPIFIIGSTIGLTGTLLHLDFAAHVPLALAYAAAMLRWVPNSPLLAAGGQMALTNYLTQSIVFCLVFYGYGLGQFGRLEVLPTAAAGLAFFIAQLAFSRWWLRHFHFGPGEWVWRSLTYGQRQPLLRETNPTLSRAGVSALMVVVFLFAIPLVHGVLPWILARQSHYWGWTAAGLPGILNAAGLLLVAIAAVLVLWILTTNLQEARLMPSRVTLSLRPARLVQTGPYAWTRHPMYLAEILSWLGIAAYFGNPVMIAAIVMGAMLIMPVVITREERALESHFGDEYRLYRQRVPRFTDLKAHPPPAPCRASAYAAVKPPSTINVPPVE